MTCHNEQEIGRKIGRARFAIGALKRLVRSISYSAHESTRGLPFIIAASRLLHVSNSSNELLLEV